MPEGYWLRIKWGGWTTQPFRCFQKYPKIEVPPNQEFMRVFHYKPPNHFKNMSQESQVYWVYCSGARHLKPLFPQAARSWRICLYFFFNYYHHHNYYYARVRLKMSPCALRKVATKPSKATFTLALKPVNHGSCFLPYRDRGTVRMNQKPMEFGSLWSTVIPMNIVWVDLFFQQNISQSSGNKLYSNCSSHFEMKINGSQVHTKTTRSSLFY